MAQVILSSLGAALGGPTGGAIGAVLGAAADRAAIQALTPARQIGPRLTGLPLQSTAEGAPMAAVFGRARIAGQVIWAARFKESRVRDRTGGGKGGAKTVDFRYSLSFAVALCEGPIDGVGRIWADGKAFQPGGAVMRLYRGDEAQTPDPLIEAVEGAAPAYRGTAYVVFEDLALDAYGDRLPQLMFEVFRRPRGETPALEDRLTAVCLIPGAGEFALAPEPVFQRHGLTRSRAENVNNAAGVADLMASLDQLQDQAPNLDTVTVVVGWFGDDLRCGACKIRPGVETGDKSTFPSEWSVQGLDRSQARVISTIGGGPAYGGTPSDRSVLQAIAELKARGLKVALYPFLFMDVPPVNGLPDPHGGAHQPAYPWRGRITCHPAPGQIGSPDKTPGAADQVAAFFGGCAPGDFSLGEGVAYAGPDEWSFRRFVLHYAALAKLAGGVDSFLIGSELRALTTVRDGASTYPAVAGFRALAADVRVLLDAPSTAIGYAADWSEYFGHQPTDGSGDVHFHLDPLWADPAIDFVGIDYYPPLADWRDGETHLDALAGFSGPHDPAYVAANIAGGEFYDWHYASDADRLSQTRTPITDGAHGEPWVFRAKDLWNWWSRAHHDRPGGLRSPAPTAWTPRGKPIRLVEFGCPAVDRGANAPNLFIDPKSSESRLPPFSSGARDDTGQRACLDAVLTHFADPAHNPASPVYGRPMVESLQAWAWDARPFPDFPARAEIWADAANWRLGHWLNGRLGVAPLADLTKSLVARGGVALATEAVRGQVAGYVVDRPMRLRDALAPLCDAFGLEAAERGGQACLLGLAPADHLTLGEADLTLGEGQGAPCSDSRLTETPPDRLRLRFIDQQADYRTGSATLLRDPPAGGGDEDVDLAIVGSPADAIRWGQARQARQAGAKDQRTVSLAPMTALRLEPGDRVRLDGESRLWRVLRLDLDEAPTALLGPVPPDLASDFARPDWRAGPVASAPSLPVLHLLDLPALPGREDDIRPLAAIAADPWAPHDLHGGPDTASLSLRATVGLSATLGQTLSELPAGPMHRFDHRAQLVVHLEGAALQSRLRAAVLAGANSLALLHPAGEWEVVQFLTAEPIAPETWRLGGLLRGQLGTEGALTPVLPADAPAVLLDDSLTRVDLAGFERGLPYLWRLAPAGAPPASGAVQAQFTWRGLALRPWSPCHLRLGAALDGLRLSWVRRSRVGGDSWEGEVPVGEEAERYLVEVFDGTSVIRTAETSEPAYVYGTAEQAADFPAGIPNPLSVRVAQGSAVFGWGSPATRSLVW